jgi:hypothetical protein
MKLFFISATSRSRHKTRKAESAYREAIKENLEFSEIKKLYLELKRLQQELQDHQYKKIEERMGISLL